MDVIKPGVINGALLVLVSHDGPRIRLQLGYGPYRSQPIIDSDALTTTHIPHANLGAPTAPAARTKFYGLGWNVT